MKHWTKLIIFLLLLTCCACTPNPAPLNEHQSNGHWKATLMTSGGVTGGGGGLSVWSDGSVFQLDSSDPGKPLMTKYLGVVPLSKTVSLEKLLLQSLETEQQEYGNMTTTLVWEREGPENHFWAWESGIENAGKPLQDVQTSFNLSTLKPERKENRGPRYGDLKPLKARLDLLIGQGQENTVSLTIEEDTFQGKFTGEVGQLSDLESQTATLPDNFGDIKITEAKNGWVSGAVQSAGKETTFRLPAWVTTAP